MSWRYEYKPYVPVAQRRAQAAKEVAKRVKKGEAVSPVVIEGRKITATFWGNAWCKNLESYSDFENRLPRGRTYVRNGSVVHMKIKKGRIEALVSGSELYKVQIDILALPKRAWQVVKELCAGKIGSLVELLQGKLSNAVMEAVTDRDQGLFPKPREIAMRCSCPDYAGMCKHVAAVMYGIGNRLDSSPELLFELRGLDHRELIEQAIPAAPTHTKSSAATIATDELGAIFDIEIDDTPATAPDAEIHEKPPAKTAAKVKKASATKKTATAKKASAAKETVTVKKVSAAQKTAAVKKAAAAKGKKAAPASRKG
ncbi:MAG: SWIM zinc finger family protein [Isosphaeraceae bacterium]|nr:SWIM zinc finger family protein [Isosphaeraceae bacterium]